MYVYEEEIHFTEPEIYSGCGGKEYELFLFLSSHFAPSFFVFVKEEAEICFPIKYFNPYNLSLILNHFHYRNAEIYALCAI
jgi:hypothetical protein